MVLRETRVRQIYTSEKKKKRGTLTSMSFLKRALSVHIFDVIFVLELGERSLKIFEIQSLIVKGWQTTTKKKWKFLKKHRSLGLKIF